MKYFKFSLLFILAFSIFTACDDEPLDPDFDTSGNTESNSIIGEWTLVSLVSEMNNEVVTPQITTESNVLIETTTVDYNLNFAESTFTASGSYSYTTDITVNGQSFSDSYTLENVSGSGLYGINGNNITVNGQLFEFTFEGVDDSAFNTESQTLEFEISNNGNTLTFYQNETQVDDSSGFDVTVTNISTSVWQRVSNNQTNNDCEEATTAANEAETAYNADTTNTDLCNAYKTALQNQITACGDTDGSILAIIDSLGDCVTETPSVEISLTAGTLPIEFDLVDVVVDGNILKVTGETSANNSYMIYFEVEEGATGTDIINSTFVLTLSTIDPYYYPSTQGFDDYTSTITENGTGTIIGSFGGIVSNSGGADLSLTSGIINVTY